MGPHVPSLAVGSVRDRGDPEGVSADPASCAKRPGSLTRLVDLCHDGPEASGPPVCGLEDSVTRSSDET